MKFEKTPNSASHGPLGSVDKKAEAPFKVAMLGIGAAATIAGMAAGALESPPEAESKESSDTHAEEILGREDPVHGMRSSDSPPPITIRRAVN